MNKLITLNNKTLTMSSREISELINKNHSDLCRSIERLMAKGVIKRYQPMAYTHPQNGQIYKEFHLEKRDCLIVVAQNCPEFTAIVVDRWQELENQIRQPIDPMQMLNDPQALRGLLGNYTEKVITLEHKVEEMQPTVEAYERIAVATDGAVCITDAAKILQMKPKELFKWLFVHKWIYRRPGNAGWIAYQDKLQQLLLEHKIHIARREDGTEKVCEQVLITPKGLAKLAKSLNIELS